MGGWRPLQGGFLPYGLPFSPSGRSWGRPCPFQHELHPEPLSGACASSLGPPGGGKGRCPRKAVLIPGSTCQEGAWGRGMPPVTLPLQPVEEGGPPVLTGYPGSPGSPRSPRSPAGPCVTRTTAKMGLRVQRMLTWASLATPSTELQAASPLLSPPLLFTQQEAGVHLSLGPGDERWRGCSPDLQVAQGAPRPCRPRPAPPVDTEAALGQNTCSRRMPHAPPTLGPAVFLRDGDQPLRVTGGRQASAGRGRRGVTASPEHGTQMVAHTRVLVSIPPERPKATPLAGSSLRAGGSEPVAHPALHSTRELLSPAEKGVWGEGGNRNTHGDGVS